MKDWPMSKTTTKVERKPKIDYLIYLDQVVYISGFPNSSL
jgi:hypothetical protein